MNLLNIINKKNERNEKKIITFLNPYSYFLARKEIELFSNFNIKIDGILLVKILKFFGFKNINRESFDMTSLAPKVFEDSIKCLQTVYIIGTKPIVIDKAIENIKKTYPLINIIGYKDGYFKNTSERDELIANICKLNPDIVICGMGTPLQEKFLLDLENNDWNGIGYTCGGFLHQIATGKINYYPPFINKYNLRWIYRIYDEPKLIKRYFILYPLSFFYLIIDYINFKYIKSRKKVKEK